MLNLRKIFPTAYAFVFCAVFISPVHAEDAADIVLRNGSIHTISATRQVTEALAIRRGKIVYVGANGGIEPFVGSSTIVIDLQGKMVLPGFQDAHVHPLGGGQLISQCDLRSAKTGADAAEIVRKYVLKNPKLKWIEGAGWPLPLFLNANPDKALLDTASPDSPVYLLSEDGHSAWVNSRALQLAGINRDTPNPVNGRIEHYPNTGEPSGTLREDAILLVSKLIPEPSPDQIREWLSVGLAEASKFGITSIQDADVPESYLKAYSYLEKHGLLNTRVHVAMSSDNAKRESMLPYFKEMRRKYHTHLLQAKTVKIYADGVIEAKTAALLEPYVGMKELRGEPNYSAENLNRYVKFLDKAGFQIHVHAIGDRAIRMTLDALEEARKTNGSRDSRHHIAHLELLDPHDIPRFRKLGVAANFQPLWAFADPYIKDLTLPFIGTERARWLYPIESVVKTGTMLVCGSDWPVSSMNPLEAIQVALTRLDFKNPIGEPFIPEEIVDMPTILAGYTINAAFINFLEKETGSIEVGKAADIVVLERNLFDIPAKEIGKVKVLLTLLEGREVYRNPSFQALSLQSSKVSLSDSDIDHSDK